MKRRIQKQQRLVTALFLSALVLAAVTSALYYARVDCTSSKAFTLSAAAKNLHEEIPEYVRITYYVSKPLRERHSVPSEVEDMLRELEAANKGKIRIRISDPGNDASEAEGFGVVPQHMQTVEASEQRIALVYSGIVLEYLDRHETLPSVYSSDMLEYELIKAIRALVSNSHPIAACIAGDSDKTLANDYTLVTNVLRRAGYEVRELARGDYIDDDVGILFVLGNEAVSRFDACRIDNFIMRGGKVFFAVKGVTVNADKGLAASALRDNSLLAMLANYGIQLAPQLLLDEACLTVPFQTQSPQSAYRIQYIPYPHWITLDARYIHREHPLTAGCSGLDLYWPSPLYIHPASDITYTELAKTTPAAWLQKNNFSTGPEDEGGYTAERGETSGQYLVAAAAQGIFQSAFMETDIPIKNGERAVAEGSYKNFSNAARIIVVSSADFLTDLMKMSDSGFNASFALSAADWLCSNEDLASIRSRIVSDTRLNKIKDNSTKKFLIHLTYGINVVFIPCGVIVFALIRARRRGAKRSEDINGIA